MTLVIGARCRDGIVIGSDRKVMRGGEASYENKIFETNNIILGIAGLTGIRDDFLLLLEDRMRRFRFESLYEVKLEVEDIIYRLSERYKERIREESPIEAVMGGLERITRGDAKLYHILGGGYGEEEMRFVCIGHGAPYATSLVKFLYDQSTEVEQMAKMIAFVILYVGEDVDTFCGGRPMVAMVTDKKPGIRYLEEDVLNKIEGKARDVKENLPNLLKLEEL